MLKIYFYYKWSSFDKVQDQGHKIVTKIKNT